LNTTCDIPGKLQNNTIIPKNKTINLPVSAKVNIQVAQPNKDETKPNILVVNTEYLKTLSNAQSFDYKKCNFIECGIEMKYN
jgi:hypothetical protein